MVEYWISSKLDAVVDLYSCLPVFLFFSGLTNSMEFLQIPCTGFGRKSMIGDGNDLWNYQKYRMDLLSLILWWSRPKFKLLGVIFFKSPNYYWFNFLFALLFGNSENSWGQTLVARTLHLCCTYGFECFCSTLSPSAVCCLFSCSLLF